MATVAAAMPAILFTGPGYPRRSAPKLLDVQPFSIRRISLADPISATRKSHGRGSPRQSPALTTALVGVRPRLIRSARRRFPGTPSRSPVRIGMRVRPRSPPVIVAASPVPIGTPTWVPEVAWAPLREGARLSLSLRRSVQTGQPQAGGHRGRRCYKVDDIFHIAFLANISGAPVSAFSLAPPATTVASMRLKRNTFGVVVHLSFLIQRQSHTKLPYCEANSLKTQTSNQSGRRDRRTYRFFSCDFVAKPADRQR